jgi:hypothetical protein
MYFVAVQNLSIPSKDSLCYVLCVLSVHILYIYIAVQCMVYINYHRITIDRFEPGVVVIRAVHYGDLKDRQNKLCDWRDSQHYRELK